MIYPHLSIRKKHLTMKAALALIFFACVAGSMASDVRGQFVQQLVQQGQAAAQSLLTVAQQQILGLVQQAVGQLSNLVASIGRFDVSSIFNGLVDQFKPLLQGAINEALGAVIGGLQGLIGGRASIDLAGIFQNFLQEITTPIVSMGQHLLNQGLATVLGGLGSLGGSRGIADIFAGLQQQVAGVVSGAQAALTGALNNITAIGSNILDASKPHFQQLQEQLVGHGLNVLGSISETVNNLHGSITGGR
jgi:hypothetical protein